MPPIVKRSTIVQCSIASCKSHSRQNCKDRKIVFFNVPRCNREVKVHGTMINNINQGQYESWMSAITLGYQEGCSKHCNYHNIMLCAHHFYPLVSQNVTIMASTNWKLELPLQHALLLSFQWKIMISKNKKYLQDSSMSWRISVRVQLRNRK